jgi:hypothetical protein
MMRVKTAERLNRADLENLISGQLYALRVPEFYNEKYCGPLTDLILKTNRSEYTHEVVGPDGKKISLDYGVQSAGGLLPFNQVVLNPEKEQAYFIEAKKKRIENQFKNLAVQSGIMEMPGQKLLKSILNLDFDIRPAIWNGREMRAGLFRVTKPNAERLQESPHVDSLNADFNSHVQFGANIYLQVPEMGGNLCIWDIEKPLTAKEVKKVETDEQNFKKILSQSKSIEIKIEAGDLVILNTRVPHAVTLYKQGLNMRVSYSEFLCLNNPQGIIFRYS